MQAIFDYWQLLLDGLLITVVVTVFGSLLAFLIAFFVGIARVARSAWLRVPSAVIVEVFRGTSLLVLMFWLFFALPFLGIELTPIFAGVLALGLNGGAYGAEIVRTTIKGRPKGQTEAIVALGIPRTVALWRILIPQSIPAMLPPFGNILVDLLKASSLVSLVTIADLTFRAQMVRAATGETIAVFGVVLVLYFLLALLCGELVKWLERRFDLARPASKKRSLLLDSPKKVEAKHVVG